MSKATNLALGPTIAAARRTRIPVPHATSKTRSPSCRGTDARWTTDQGAKIAGTMYLSKTSQGASACRLHASSCVTSKCNVHNLRRVKCRRTSAERHIRGSRLADTVHMDALQPGRSASQLQPGLVDSDPWCDGTQPAAPAHQLRGPGARARGSRVAVFESAPGDAHWRWRSRENTTGAGARGSQASPVC